MIIVFGPGRCGTKSIEKLLAVQPGLTVRHEPYHLPWNFDHNEYNKWKTEIKTENMADIGFYFLNYIEQIICDFPNAVFLRLERKASEIAKSFLNWSGNHNLWTSKKSKFWNEKCLDALAFPKYNLNKNDAIEKYIKDYNEKADILCQLYKQIISVRIKEFFNDSLYQKRIFEEIGLKKYNICLGIHINGA